MNLWGKVLALFVAAVLAVVFLRALPPLVVLALFAAGVIYANHVLTVRPKREARASAGLPGFRREPIAPWEMGAYPLALLLRPAARVSDVAVGRWRGVDVRVFDLELAPTATDDAVVGARRFTCVLAPLPSASPHVVIEPKVFLTPEAERPSLPAAAVTDERVAASFDVRCEDPSFVPSLMEERLVAWLVEHEDPVGVELRGPVVLVYRSWVPGADRDGMLELLAGFLDAVPADLGVQP